MFTEQKPEKKNISIEFEESMRNQISNFLSEYPLYKRLSIDEMCADLNQMKQYSFQSYCDIAKTFKPFLTDIYKSVHEPLSSRLVQSAGWILKNITKEYDFTETYSATCQHCQEFKAYFTIHGVGVRSNDGINNFYIEKVGQYPPLQIDPEAIFKNFLSKPDVKFYKKGKMLFNQNFGIGALAYWRRIIENEIKRIAIETMTSETTAKSIFEPLLKDKKLKIVDIIDKLTKHLPKEALLDGENPFKILYSSVSDGIHNLNEDQCTERAKNIEQLLKHVITTLNQEREKKLSKNALDDLRKSLGE
jgi:hypothetical protein